MTKEVIRIGDRIKFRYHDVIRDGVVEKVDAARDFVVIRHTVPELHDDKVYSTYKFSKMQSLPRLHPSTS
jgi:hypothetical protein